MLNLLKQWEQDLNERSIIEKNTYKGKTDTSTFEQTKDNIKPLFKLCKVQQIPEDILIKLHLSVLI